jgi:hypothetical protein
VNFAHQATSKLAHFVSLKKIMFHMMLSAAALVTEERVSGARNDFLLHAWRGITRVRREFFALKNINRMCVCALVVVVVDPSYIASERSSEYVFPAFIVPKRLILRVSQVPICGACF